MKSIYLIETYAYETSKDLASEKEIKRNNIIKEQKKRLTLIMLQIKT